MSAQWPRVTARARHDQTRCRTRPRPRKDDRLVTFPDVETTAPSPVNLNRQKRQLADQAIAQATAAQWAEAAATNRKLLELGPDAEAENRLAKSLWEET